MNSPAQPAILVYIVSLRRNTIQVDKFCYFIFVSQHSEDQVALKIDFQQAKCLICAALNKGEYLIVLKKGGLGVGVGSMQVLNDIDQPRCSRLLLKSQLEGGQYLYLVCDSSFSKTLSKCKQLDRAILGLFRQPSCSFRIWVRIIQAKYLVKNFVSKKKKQVFFIVILNVI